MPEAKIRTLFTMQPAWLGLGFNGPKPCMVLKQILGDTYGIYTTFPIIGPLIPLKTGTLAELQPWMNKWAHGDMDNVP